MPAHPSTPTTRAAQSGIRRHRRRRRSRRAPVRRGPIPISADDTAQGKRRITPHNEKDSPAHIRQSLELEPGMIPRADHEIGGDRKPDANREPNRSAPCRHDVDLLKEERGLQRQPPRRPDLAVGPGKAADEVCGCTSGTGPVGEPLRAPRVSRSGAGARRSRTLERTPFPLFIGGKGVRKAHKR